MGKTILKTLSFSRILTGNRRRVFEQVKESRQIANMCHPSIIGLQLLWELGLSRNRNCLHASAMYLIQHISIERYYKIHRIELTDLSWIQNAT